MQRTAEADGGVRRADGKIICDRPQGIGGGRPGQNEIAAAARWRNLLFSEKSFDFLTPEILYLP